jgi:hypothetical protein
VGEGGEVWERKLWEREVKEGEKCVLRVVRKEVCFEGGEKRSVF